MSDAAEVLNAVYDSLGAVPGGAELVDSVFGLRVREVVHCGSCGRDTHEAAYTQSFYNVSTTALRFQALSLEPGEASPTLVRPVSGQGIAESLLRTAHQGHASLHADSWIGPPASTWQELWRSLWNPLVEFVLAYMPGVDSTAGWPVVDLSAAHLASLFTLTSEHVFWSELI